MLDLRWADRLEDAEIAEVAAVIDAATVADGQSPVSEHVLLHLRGDQGASTNLLARAGGQLAGYAHLDATDQFGGATGELVVHPDHRRRGVATELVGALVERADSGRGRLRLWAHGEHPGAARLAQRFGFTRARVLLQLRRSLLSALAQPSLPDGVRLRTFRVGEDEQRFVEVNNRAFDWHPEQGGWGVEQVRLREAEPWFDPEGLLLAVDSDDRLLGFHWTKVHTAPSPIGEVYVLGVDPTAHGHGLGVALTLAGLHHLRGKGLREVMLYVEADNTAAVAMYRKLGFADWDSDVAYLR